MPRAAMRGARLAGTNEFDWVVMDSPFVGRRRAVMETTPDRAPIDTKEEKIVCYSAVPTSNAPSVISRASCRLAGCGWSVPLNVPLHARRGKIGRNPSRARGLRTFAAAARRGPLEQSLPLSRIRRERRRSFELVARLFAPAELLEQIRARARRR